MKIRREQSKKRRIFDLCLLASIPIWLYSFTNSIIFHPPRCSYQSSDSVVIIAVENNEHIAAFYLPAADDAFVVLHSHGNAEDIGYLRDYIRCFKAEGFGVLAYDYRGYGLSDGTPSEQNSYKDIEAAYHYLVDQQHIDPRRIIVHGRSVGSGPSVWLAEKYPVGGLVLISPFVSAFRTRTHWPILPFDKYNNLSRIKNIHCPLLVMHGRKDRVIRLWHGKKLYEAANDPKMHHWIDDAGHNNFLEIGWDEYWKTIHVFKDLVKQSQKQAGEVSAK